MLDEENIKNDMHIRITNFATFELLNEIKKEYGIKSTNYIINEGLRYGLPILKKQLETPGGLAAVDEYRNIETTEEIQDFMNIIEEILKENNLEMLFLQAKVNVLMQMVSSIYSRQKLSWQFEKEYPDLAKQTEDKLDNTMPEQFKNKIEEYKKMIFASED